MSDSGVAMTTVSAADTAGCEENAVLASGHQSFGGRDQSIPYVAGLIVCTRLWIQHAPGPMCVIMFCQDTPMTSLRQRRWKLFVSPLVFCTSSRPHWYRVWCWGHFHHHAARRDATKTASITWLLLSSYLYAIRVVSMSWSSCISASGLSWWYHWTGDEGALSLCDLVTSSWGVQSTGDSFWSEDLPYMAALSDRVFPCLSLCPSRLSSWSNADVASWRHAAFSPVVCTLSMPRLHRGGWTSRLHGISCL